jgi:hypothetical protein
MAPSIFAGGKSIDIAGMPRRRRGYARVRASAVVIDPRDDAVVTVFEARINRVDLL